MIKSKPPRPKSSKPNDGGGDATADKSQKNGGGGGGGGSAAAAAAASKKRRPSQKKKEAADGAADSKRRSIGGVPSSGHSVAALHLEEHRRYYQRAPRLLPDINGVQSLSSSEIQSDLKHLASSLSVFESKMAALLPPGATNPITAGGGVYIHGNKETSSTAAALGMEDTGGGGGGGFLFQKRRARATGVITPEELVETLPVCRRAVRITQRELAAMKRERDDLERDFMRQRNTLLWQMGEMKRIQRQQDKVLKTLSQDVVHKAKSLESSRRRTNALQDIMTELDARGSTVLRLTREKHQLETLLTKHELELPEPEEIYLGDRVTSQFGKGHVMAMDDVQRTVTVELESGATAYLQEEMVEVLPSEISYAETEKQLKSKLFEKIGALVQPNGTLRFLAGGGGAGGGGRRRNRAEMADDLDADMAADTLGRADSDDDGEDEDEEDTNEAENGGVNGGEEPSRASRRASTGGDAVASTVMEDEGGKKRPSKKRKLMVMAPASSSSSTSTSTAQSKKKAKQHQQQQQQQHGKVLDFTAGKIPITPYDVGLLLSPLSVLPERVAAVGPDALQWMASYLPAKMAEWERDRYESLQMQGEIERLRFQLQQAQVEKEDAQELAVEQVDAMNDLVRQIEKLRDQIGPKEAKDKGDHGSGTTTSTTNATPGTSNGSGSPSCPNCSSLSSGSSHKKAKQAGKSNGKSGGGSKSSSNRRQRSESMDVGSEDKEKPKDRSRSRDDSDAPDTVDAAGGPHDDGDDDGDNGNDGGESSDNASKPAARSLRPRRASSGTSNAVASSVSK